MAKYRVDGYYNDFEIFKIDLLKLKNRLGRFPNKEEILSNLKIGYQYIQKHGGMYGLKRKLNIINEDFIDKSGFYNKSSYEMIVANFLIENNIPYSREQKITENENFRSDFTFTKSTGQIVHIEVWGYLKTNKSKIAREYNKARQQKEKIYSERNISLISIEPNIFHKKNYDTIQNSLLDIFSFFSNNKLIKVDNEILIPSSNLSDNELLEIAMSISNNENYLPTTMQLRNFNRGAYTTILKRYKTYQNFAEKYNRKVENKPNNFWNKDKIFDCFDYMYDNFQKILSQREINIIKDNDEFIKTHSSIIVTIQKTFGSIYDIKLDYFSNRLSRNLKVTDEDIKWIKNLGVNLTRRGNKLVSDETQEKAIKLLESLSLHPTT